MVCKDSLVFSLLFKLRISLIFVKKVFRAKKILKDFRSLIRGKTLDKALAGVVD